MKFLLLLATILLSTLNSLEGCDDAEKRFEDFLNASIPGFIPWIEASPPGPFPLDYYNKEARFSVRSAIGDRSTYDLDGVITAGWYHYGNDFNVSPERIHVNLTEPFFCMELLYGGKADFVTALYSINGSSFSRSLQGSGNLTRSSFSGLHFKVWSDLEVTSDGFFRIVNPKVEIHFPKFQNLTLENFQELDSERIFSFVNAWYEMHFMDYPPMYMYWLYYLVEVFENTPVEEIIGEPWPSRR